LKKIIIGFIFTNSVNMFWSAMLFFACFAIMRRKLFTWLFACILANLIFFEYLSIQLLIYLLLRPLSCSNNNWCYKDQNNANIPKVYYHFHPHIYQWPPPSSMWWITFFYCLQTVTIFPFQSIFFHHGKSLFPEKKNLL